MKRARSASSSTSPSASSSSSIDDARMAKILARKDTRRAKKLMKRAAKKKAAVMKAAGIGDDEEDLGEPAGDEDSNNNKEEEEEGEEEGEGEESEKSERRPPPAKVVKVAGVGNGLPPGARASVDIKFPTETRTLRDIQCLVLWLLADGPMPNWAVVRHMPLISKVVVLAVPGLGTPVLARFRPSHLGKVVAALGEPLITTCPGSKTRVHAAIHSFLNTPKASQKSLGGSATPNTPNTPGAAGTPSAQKAAAVRLVPTPTSTSNNNSSSSISAVVLTPQPAGKEPQTPQGAGAPLPGPEHYVQTPEELSVNLYPMPGAGGYLETVPGPNQAGPPRVFALDCEMCLTGINELALTRFTLIDEEGNVVLNEFVMPEKPIIDYNTRFSGITAEHLAGVTMNKAQARDLFLKTVSSRDILLGHSLENDLHALKIVHTRVIDTALLYPHPRGPPFKSALRFLAKQHLNIEIQKTTHDSREDALACLHLLQLKLKNGPDFGQPRSDTEKIFSALARCGVRSTLIESASIAKLYTTEATSVVSLDDSYRDAEAVEKVIAEVRGASPSRFIWARLPDLARVQEQGPQPVKGGEEGEVAPEGDVSPVGDAVRAVAAHIARVWESLPPNTCLIIPTLHGDLYEYKKELQKVSTTEQIPGDPPVSDTLLSFYTAGARAALTFVKVK
jgi:RNA exonuclease 1